MFEEWRNIPGYEGKYQVSNLGNVKSLPRTRKSKAGSISEVKGRILKQNTDKDGYKNVALCMDGRLKYFRVHRLVAAAFIPNPDNLPMINHKDENPANNCVENLEWCTNSYNTSYSNYKVSRPVICNGIRYKSIRALGRAIDADGHAIRYRAENGGLFRGKYHITYE